MGFKAMTFVIVATLTLSAPVAFAAAKAKATPLKAAQATPVKAPSVKGAEKFYATCVDVMKKSGQKLDPNATCGCIVRGHGDNKVKPKEFDLLEQNYRTPLDIEKAQAQHPDIEVGTLVDLDFQIATECVKNPHFKVKRN